MPLSAKVQIAIALLLKMIQNVHILNYGDRGIIFRVPKNDLFLAIFPALGHFSLFCTNMQDILLTRLQITEMVSAGDLEGRLRSFCGKRPKTHQKH